MDKTLALMRLQLTLFAIVWLVAFVAIWLTLEMPTVSESEPVKLEQPVYQGPNLFDQGR